MVGCDDLLTLELVAEYLLPLSDTHLQPALDWIWQSGSTSNSIIVSRVELLRLTAVETFGDTCSLWNLVVEVCQELLAYVSGWKLLGLPGDTVSGGKQFSNSSEVTSSRNGGNAP